MSSQDRTYVPTVQAVETSFSIIEYLNEHERSNMQAMADHLGIAKSTVFKHLKTLEGLGWVVEEDHVYALSYQFLQVGGTQRDRNRLCRVTIPKLRKFSQEVGLMGMYSECVGNRGVFLYRVNDTIGLGKGIPIGSYFELYQNAAGKAMLAERSDEEIETIVEESGLDPVTDNTITGMDKLAQDISAIRDRGYGINMGERKEQFNAVACTVLDEDRNTLGAVSLCGPVSQLPEERLHEIGEQTRIITDEINIQIKYG